jgi:hypothetical protein
MELPGSIRKSYIVFSGRSHPLFRELLPVEGPGVTGVYGKRMVKRFTGPAILLLIKVDKSEVVPAVEI